MIDDRKSRTNAKWRRSFSGDESGTVGIIFGLSVVPMMLMLGVAIDYERAAVARSRLQGAADTAAIAVAGQPNLSQSERQALAQNSVRANMGQLANSLNLTITESEPGANSFQVAATGSVPTTVMKIARFNSIDISAQSTAQLAATNSSAGTGCVLSLAQSAVDADAFEAIGNANVNLSNCDIYDNSDNSSALEVGGNATLSARYVNVTGGVVTHGNNKLMAKAVYANTGKQIADPYNDPSNTAYKVDMPSYSGCKETNYSANDEVTLGPGVYCGGMSLNAKAKVTLNPGLYVIDGGSFTVNAQATLTGNGVTLAFTSSTGQNYPTVTINGGATVRLTAAKSAALAENDAIPGIVLYGDRNMPIGTSFKLNGGSTQVFGGAIYLPSADLKFIGNSSTDTGAAGCTKLIADKITFQGTSEIRIDGCNDMALASFGASRTVSLAE